MVPRTRGVTPVVGTVLLLAVCVAASAVLAVTVVGIGASANRAPTTPSVVTASASADGSVTLAYHAGPSLNVDDLHVRVTVNGTPLAEQPPVPFVGARGFDGAPSGPFNAASDGVWTPGESAGFRVAGTNAPALSAGARLVVAVFRGRHRVAVARTTVSG